RLLPYPGYSTDSGAGYGVHGSLTYGWDHVNRGMVSRGGDPLSPDQRYDTFAQMESTEFGALTWEIAVPNGNYKVHAVAGDPISTSGTFKTNVEGMLTINGSPSASQHWLQAT